LTMECEVCLAQPDGELVTLFQREPLSESKWEFCVQNDRGDKNRIIDPNLPSSLLLELNRVVFLRPVARIEPPRLPGNRRAERH
jgi:hypothetical protein